MPPPRAASGLRLSYGRLKDALYYVQNCYDREVSIQEAAKRCGFSESYFMKLFKEFTGMSFNAYLVDYRLELAAKQLESVKDQFVRLTAEYENYRKRTAKEKDGLYQDARADTIREFLAVYDNLERACAAEGDDDSPHKKGLVMIFHQYQEILKKLGVEEIAALGQTFDPETMNAVMHVDDGRFGENEVAQVFQAGFTLGGKVIRHAVVQVAN